jgi:hypothetical protein
MKLKIESCLTEPPSEISCFRDVTLYARTFVFEDVLLVCPPGTRSLYWEWLKSHGAHDFISELIRTDQKEPGYSIGTTPGSNILTDRIACYNLSEIISLLQQFHC